MDACNRKAGRPGRIRRWGLLMLLTVIGGGLAVAMSRGLLPWQGRPTPAFAPDALEDYVPEDTLAVLRINVQSVRESPAGRKYLGPLLRAALRDGQKRYGWVPLLGGQLPDDLHWLQLSVGKSGLEQPLWLAGGKWEAERLQVGTDRLQPQVEQEFHLYTFLDPGSQRITTLTPAGSTLIASIDREQVLTALQQAVQPAPVHLKDATMAELWQKGNRRQTLWGAANLSASKLSSRLLGNRVVKRLLPLLRHTGSVEGGLHCGEDIHAELHFEASDEDEAHQLEQEVQNVCLAAPLLRLLKMDSSLVPLVDLLMNGKTSREGTVVTLKSQLPSE